MPIATKNRINFLNIANIFALFTIFFLFFPIRYTFLTSSTFVTGIYSDFTSISLYISDIFLFVTFIFVLIPRGGELLKSLYSKKWLIYWIILAFLLNFVINPNSYEVFWLFKLLELIVAYGTFTVLFKETSLKESFLWVFVILSTIQSIFGLIQFSIQRPIGLFKLGEQQIYPFGQGIAKIIINGSAFVRAYGTFPHPNVLSAYLLTGIFVSLYLYISANKPYLSILAAVCLMFNIMGVAATFSRAAYLCTFLGILAYFGYISWYKHIKNVPNYLWHRIVSSFLIVIIATLGSIFMFRQFLLARATISDQATIERGYYDSVGLKMIISHPFFGVGPGQSMFHMQQYSNFKLLPWEYQPIHNYYLLTAAELGIPGLLTLVWIFWLDFKYLLSSIRYKVSENFELTTYYLLLTTLLLCFLILMLFDHYFYTLQQTQFLLWILLALISATKNSPEGEH